MKLKSVALFKVASIATSKIVIELVNEIVSIMQIVGKLSLKLVKMM